MPTTVPEGWYPDPNGLPSDRYWDGNDWTDKTRPQTPRPPVPPVHQSREPDLRGSTQTGGYVNTVAPRNGMGVAALVFGILALFTPLIAPLLAVIFGAIGNNRAKRGEATNRGMALWGLWLGWIAWAGWVALYLIILASN